MNSITPSQAGDLRSIATPAVQADTEFRRRAPAVENLPASLQLGPRRSGYGLPCAKCKTYYAADLASCPVCKGAERVSPTIVASSAAIGERAEPYTAPVPDDAALEEERERFLREFKAQVYASHTQINVAESFKCSLEVNHPGESEPAAVCQGCYVRLQERVDLLEAALHMDLKDATQVIYDAVWSDPSDPSKTYHNAAQAVLVELRKRAGISAVLGPLRTLSH
jgi:hypothetical protein